ncbi:MAG: hypothetical protein WD897_00810 [Parcubacteria group bacterium]
MYEDHTLEAVSRRFAAVCDVTVETAEALFKKASKKLKEKENLDCWGKKFDPDKTQPLPPISA